MDQIKLLVKDVLYKMQDGPEVPFTSIRMSELVSQSPTFSETLTVSIKDETVLSEIDYDNNNGTVIEKVTNTETRSSFFEDTLKPARVKTMSSHIEGINNKIGTDDSASTQKDKETGNDELFQLSIKSIEAPKHIYPDVIEIRKTASIASDLESLYLNGNGSVDSGLSVANQSPVLGKTLKPSRPKIMMGKRALFKSRSGEMDNDPATVVHELVHDKYYDKISGCINRMYHRRISRESRSTDDDGTSSNYSGRSLRTPDSIHEGNNYFALLYPSTPERDVEIDNSVEDLDKFETPVMRRSPAVKPITNDMEADLDYDAQKFLKDALGGLSYQDFINAPMKTSSKLVQSNSMDPVSRPSMLRRASSFYDSVRSSIRRSYSFRDRNTYENTSTITASDKKKNRNRDRCQSFSPDYCGSAENLMQELYIQNGIIFQVSKALTLCRNSKDVTSQEYIEAEKILLVASCHKEAIQATLDSGDYYDMSCKAFFGILEITDITFYLRADRYRDQDNTHPPSSDEYFVIVATSGKTVLSSKVLVPNKNGEVKSDKTFKFTGLQTDFVISVAMYCMKVDKSRGHETKLHKKPSFFHLNLHKNSRKNLLVDNVSSIKPSAFMLWGSCIITNGDFKKSHFRMRHVPLCSSLESYFTAKLFTDLEMKNRYTGFLTIGVPSDKSPTIWNRRWCVIHGSLLKYWNYPSEEFTVEPIGTIDLSCAIEKALPAERSKCSRPKTLCILLKFNEDEDGVRPYFLSTDNLEEKLRWQEEINSVIDSLIEWHHPRGGKISSL